MSNTQGIFSGKRVASTIGGKPLLYQRYNSVEEILQKTATGASGDVQALEGSAKRKDKKRKRQADVEPGPVTAGVATSSAPQPKKKKKGRGGSINQGTDPPQAAVTLVQSPAADAAGAVNTAPAVDAAGAANTAAGVSHDSDKAGKKQKKRRRDVDGVNGVAAGAVPAQLASDSQEQHNALGGNNAADAPKRQGNAQEAIHIREVATSQQPAVEPAAAPAPSSATAAAAQAVEADPETKAKLDWIMLADSSVDGFVPRRAYIGGMPYHYDEDAIRECWKECGEIEDMHMMRFQDSGRFNGIVFVTFTTEEGLQKALAYDGEELDGQTLKVSKCKLSALKKVHKGANPRGHERGPQASADDAVKRRPQYTPGTEPQKAPGYHVAYVGNVAFEAKAWDIMELFKEYKPTKARVHTDKDTGQPKGFVHVHFEDEESLDRAMALDGAELLGRRIKVKYAQPKQ